MTFCEVAIKRVYEFKLLYELLNMYIVYAYMYIVNADYSSAFTSYEHFVAFVIIFFFFYLCMRKHMDFNIERFSHNGKRNISKSSYV